MYAKNNTIIYVARASNSKNDWERVHYFCLLPQCEALHTCSSGFPIATKWYFDPDVEVVLSSAFTQRTCDLCGSLEKGVDVVATCPVALRWLCDSPRKGFAWGKSTIMHVARASNGKGDCDAWSLLLLAATVRSFAHMQLGISDCNNTFS